MSRSLETKLDFVANGDVDAFRKPPVPTCTETLYRFDRGYLDGLMKEAADRFGQVRIGSQLTQCHSNRNIIDANSGRANRHREHLSVKNVRIVPNGGAMRRDTMLSAAHTHNLSVVISRPILWYRGEFWNCAAPKLSGEPRRLGALSPDIERLSHPGERCQRFGFQFSHDAATVHLDGDFAD